MSGEVLAALQHSLMPPGIPPEVIPIAESFFRTIAIIVLGYPVIRALSRRFIERSPSASAALPPELATRLERIERAIDAIAIEVERVSESQRFLARLQTERKALDAGVEPRRQS